MDFEWDDAKNEANISRHSIDFTRAKEIFEGPLVEYIDDRHDYGEARIIAIGLAEGMEMTVVYTPRGESVGIISARRANRRERRTYYETYPG